MKYYFIATFNRAGFTYKKSRHLIICFTELLKQFLRGNFQFIIQKNQCDVYGNNIQPLYTITNLESLQNGLTA